MQTETLQDRFLHQLRTERVPVTIFLVNGFQIRCAVVGFDAFAVLVLADGKQEMIYKHAISTIIPSEALRMD